MVLHVIAWYCMVLHGPAWYCMLLHGIAWYFMVLHGIAWYCKVLFKACWSFCFELKVLNASKFSMPWPLCFWQCIKTNHETKTFETGIETPYETKSFKSKTCISLENNISIARTLRVINFTFAFNLEICETHASLNITIDL